MNNLQKSKKNNEKSEQNTQRIMNNRGRTIQLPPPKDMYCVAIGYLQHLVTRPIIGKLCSYQCFSKTKCLYLLEVG